MEVNKIDKIGAYIIVAILIFMLCFSILSFILPKIIQKLNINNTWMNNIFSLEEESTKVDWEKLYPFEETQQIKGNSNNKTNIFSKYKQKANKITTKLQDVTSKNLIKYEKIVECSYNYEKLINYSLVSNTDELARIKFDEEYLTRIIPQYNTNESAKVLIEFNDYLKELDINFTYVQAPYKISNSTNSISSIYKDYSNQNMDNLLNKINGQVDYIDLRNYIKNQSTINTDSFFKTDHHWKPTTGLWATNIISRDINNTYNMNLNIQNTEIENYEITTYKNMFLGADGKYVTLANTKPEDFELITPTFNTKLNVNILDEKINNKEGTFLETLINNEKIVYGDFYNIDQYSAYSYGTKPLIEIHNELVDNNEKVLLVRDSFGNVVIPFLALETEYLSAIDLRYFTGSLKTYIEEYNPDIVIVMYTGNHYAGFKESTNDLWKFE